MKEAAQKAAQKGGGKTGPQKFNDGLIHDIRVMEPLLPREEMGSSPLFARVENAAFDLIREASELGGHTHPVVTNEIGDLVRSMNCYYSNLIEGHHTHPRDIEDALRRDYSAEPEKRDLQREAVAHIDVQRLIDHGEDATAHPASAEYVRWLHREFCQRLPEDMLWQKGAKPGKMVRVEPGEWRKVEVQVGRHVAPASGEMARFMGRFEEVYSSPALSKTRQVIAVGAAHHRLVWIHPFADGNGRVARLQAHAIFKRLGLGSSLWSVSRGLARRVQDYKLNLQAADADRYNDYDGRGTLSEKALLEFCEFFLVVCLDQVRYMAGLLRPVALRDRIAAYVREEQEARRLPRGAFEVLREVLYEGEIGRDRVRDVTGYEERAARKVTAALLENGIVRSASPRAPLRLALPARIAERLFPGLWPPYTAAHSTGYFS